MKRLIASLLSLGLILASCQSSPQTTPTPIPPTLTPAPPTATPIPPTATPIFQDDRSVYKDGLVQSEQHVLNELPGASIYHIKFNIADNLTSITGWEQVHYTNNEQAALDEIWFRLFPNILGGEMHVSSLTVDEQPVTASYDLDDSLMIVKLDQPLEQGQSIVLGMDFNLRVPESVELNYRVLAYYDNVLALAHSYPVICVYDDEGWNAEIPPQSGDVTYADASFYLVKVTAPRDLTLAATGREISRDKAGQVQAVTYASGPARDFFLAASPDYEMVSETVGEVTIHSYAPKQLEDGAKFAADVASRAIQDFSKRYAPYPYTELDIVSTPTLALGIEYPGTIAITNRIYNVNDKDQPTNIYMESTVAHEAGHQWFYNLVGNDQLDDPWLDESLTQFATLQYYFDEYGPGGANGFHTSLTNRWKRVDNANIPIGMPVAKYSDQEYGAIVYGRGPLFFEALKNKMGAQSFDEFLGDYTKTNSWDIATPEGLKTLAEKHCACDLTALFTAWVKP